ncbi:MAG TPA: hypothetical protein PLI41_08135, partial [Bacteroidales bacterium]|nr:hypothetical protein [Bacteroidales bacterium]
MMTPDEFRKHAHELVDWIAHYLENIEDYPVKSQSKPGEILKKLPDKPPSDPQSFDNLVLDLEEIILPGMT